MPKIDMLEQVGIPLDTFREMFGIDPYMFWQLTSPYHKIMGDCDAIYFHYRYMSDKRVAGRSDFVRALAHAEAQVHDRLQYFVTPAYVEQETIQLTEFVQPVYYPDKDMTTHTKWMHISKVGKLTWTFISTTAITVTTVDTVTLTVNNIPSGCTKDEIEVCYHGTYVRIRPIRTAISGSTATIVVNKWLLVNPVVWDTTTIADHTLAASYVSSVDVYRRYIDETDQMTLVWKSTSGMCNCRRSTCQLCTLSTITACVTQNNFLYGIIAYKPASYANGQWNVVSASYPSDFPDMAYINYEHGLPLVNGDTDLYWTQILSHFAIALMPDQLCGCCDVQSETLWWQEDMGHSTGKGTFQIGANADNPFGTRRGAIAAWHAVLQGVGA